MTTNVKHTNHEDQNQFSMQPVSHQPTINRETFLDVLRGFAILGIFIANLQSFSYTDYPVKNQGQWYVPEWDNTMMFLHHWFIDGKFYSIFSLLFGWGLALQLHRSGTNEITREQVRLVKRRLTIMLLLGFVHLLIWPGDIVFFYACMGFLFLPLKRLSNKTLLITASALLLSPILLYLLKMTFPVLNAPMGLFAMAGKFILQQQGLTSGEQVRNAFMQANWWDTVQLNFAGMFFRFTDLIFTSRIPKVVGMIMIGYVIGRTGFYQRMADNKKVIVWVAIAGLAIGLPANYMLARFMELYPGDYYNLKPNGLYKTMYYAIGVAPLALAYVSLFMLAFQRLQWQRLLSALAPVGKMAFTSYIMQSLIGNFIFMNAGLGYGEKVGPVYYTLLALIVFACQLIFSTLWLRKFQYGPVEWIWRSLTYGKAQPMLKETSRHHQAILN